MNPRYGVKSSKACFSGSRFCIGIVLLLIVDVIWVASSELSKHFFFDIHHEKPYLSAYISLSMLSIYLCGFVVIRSWRKQCIRCACDDYPGQYLMIGETDTEDTDDGVDYQLQNKLSEPMYVPVKFSSDVDSSDGEKKKKSHRVQFSDLTEVRHLEESSDAQLARMPYLAALRAKFLLQMRSGILTVPQISRLSCFFALIFFAGNVAYLEAISMTGVVAVNILSSSSSLFTLVLAAIIPTDERDHITIGKLLAVISCIGGIVLVSVSSGEDLNFIDFGSVWTLVSALCCAAYVVLLRRIAGSSLNVPMFFAFIGLFTFLLLWPGLVLLHYTNVETFELPDKETAIFLTINGLIGTVVSEVLYLWGCLLTTSLVGSLSLSLTVPISVATDLAMRKKNLSWRFITGALPVFGSFIFVAIVSSTDSSMCCSRCCDKRAKQLSEQEIPLTRLSSNDS